jgi:hypothetical protein
MVALACYVAIEAFANGLCISAAEQKTGSSERVMFNIPGQPLADALVAYGAVAGIEVYYDGAWALGRRSAAVKGSFTPLHGLEILLDGTGYEPRATGPDTYTLVSVQQAELPARVSQSELRQHEQYFAALQAGIANALCGTDAGLGKQIIFSFWVTGTGAVYQTKIVGTDDGASGAAVVDRINKVNIGSPPPADVPQPITMVVYPPSREDVSGCLPSGKGETDR